MITQPSRHALDEHRYPSAMGVNVLPGDIGQKHLIAERRAVQNQRLLVPYASSAEFGGSQEKPKVERHVEARQPVAASGSVFDMSWMLKAHSLMIRQILS